MNDEEKTSSKSSSMQPDLLRLIKWLELMTKKKKLETKNTNQKKARYFKYRAKNLITDDKILAEMFNDDYVNTV